MRITPSSEVRRGQKKNDLCRNANGLFVRNLGWKRTATGYVQHKFYLGRDEHKAKVASLRLEQLWDQVCRRWERDYGWQTSNLTGKTFVRPLGLGTIGDLDGTAKFAPSPPDEVATEIPKAGGGFCIVRIGDGGPTVGERERSTWDDVTLAIAATLRDGESVAVVPVPSDEALEGQSIGDWLDGLRRDFPGVEIKLADANAHRQAEQDVEKDAQRLIDLGREKLLRRTGGASLHPALEAYAKWIDAKYVTLDGRRTAWGGTQVRQVELIRRHLPDLPLPELDAPKIETLIDVLHLRPPGEDGNRVSVSWTRNCLKQFRHFLKWLNRAPEFGWRRPPDLEFGRVRIPAALGESPARPAAARVQTYTAEELGRFWEYATPFQRLLGWQLTWEGWRGGVLPVRDKARLREDDTLAIAPALAAAACAAEAFSFYAGDHLLAGRRAAGLSLWRPGRPWQSPDPAEPRVAYLPSRLWIIGLGNLGQAFAWLLGCLPYPSDPPPLLVLQDFDRVTPANESTSLLTSSRDGRRKKARVVADWLDRRGFDTVIEERHFGPWTQRSADEPGAALCGVDNALARAALEKAGFDLIVEAGLGGGPQGFRNISMHTFPASRTAAETWSGHTPSRADVENLPAYQSLRQHGMDKCGLAQLASRTVAVPFVGLTAGCLVIAELLRRLNGGQALEVASLSMLAMDDIELVPTDAPPYALGHVPAKDPCGPAVAIPAGSGGG